MRHFGLHFALLVLFACGESTAPTSGDADGSLSPDLFACGGAGECDIRAQSCCGWCGSPVSVDMIGVNWEKGSAYTLAICSPHWKCNACGLVQDPNLAPVCRSKTCKAIDVRLEDGLSGCKVDQDCRLRFPGCCESCGGVAPGFLLALSTAGATEYVANQCKPDAGGCPTCAVQYPAGYEARCNPTTLHCEVGKQGGLDGGD